jgi:predicted ATPase
MAALVERERLVTLVGAGGIGKTRLALAVAERLIDTYPHGVWLVELASLANPVLVSDAAATALALRPEASRPILTTLTEHLKSRHLLLLLDNCMHLVTACAALVTALVRTCPDVHILATSREPIRPRAAPMVAGLTHGAAPATRGGAVFIGGGGPPAMNV